MRPSRISTAIFVIITATGLLPLAAPASAGAALANCLSLQSAEVVTTPLSRNYDVVMISNCSDTPDVSYSFWDGIARPMDVAGGYDSGSLRWGTIGDRRGLTHKLSFPLVKEASTSGVYAPTLSFNSTSLLAYGRVDLVLPSYQVTATARQPSGPTMCRKKTKDSSGKRPTRIFQRASCPGGWARA